MTSSLRAQVTGSSAMMEHFERAGGSDVGASLKKE